MAKTVKPVKPAKLKNEEMKPKIVDRIFMVFPADVSDMLPDYEQLADEFKRDTHPMSQIASEWFYYGLKDTVKFHGAEGINPEEAYNHIHCCLRSFQPKQEHKIAGVAFLLSIWFAKIEDWQLTPKEKAAKHARH